MIPDFDDEFASPADYARIYRSVGMQVVPAFMPREAKAWKRPHVGEWKQYTEELTSDETFEKWYGSGGLHSARSNMGLITGVGPRRIVVVDLDTHKNPKAEIWWNGIHGDNNAGILTETVAQRTGGGGLQYFFLAPDGWTCPTLKNSELGVDIRGANGFAMLPPSLHESGQHYEWLDGYAPWEYEIEIMPKWMCGEVDRLGVSHTPAGERVKTENPAHQVDEWGKVIDGREDIMTRMIFRRILEIYRDCPIIPSESEQSAFKKDLFESYVDIVDARLREPGTPKHMLLEREGRGITLFNQKWRATIKQWDDKICREAARPWIHDETSKKEHSPPSGEKFTVSDPEVDRPGDLFRVWTITDLKNQPPAVWIWEGIIVEGGSHYFAANPGVGKTFVGMGLGAAIASGMDSFLGRKINKHGLVIYITTEGLYDHYKRLRAFEKYYEVTVEESNYIVIPDAMNLLNERDRSRLMRTLSWEVKSRGKDPILVIFDTVSRVIPGANENDIKDMGLFVKAKADIKQAFNCSDLNMHHRAKAGDSDMRGSSGLQGEADGVYVMEREAGQEALIFRAAKIKAGPDGWEFEITMKTVETDGFHTSLVPTLPQQAKGGSGSTEFGGGQETGFQIVEGRKWPPKETCEKIIDAIQAAAVKKEPWSQSEKARDYGRYAAARIKHQFGVTEELANHMIQTWLNNDVLEAYIYDTRNKKPGLRRKKES